MSGKKALIKFDELPLRGSDLKNIPRDQAAFLAVLFCATNEVNLLLRLYSLYARHPASGSPEALSGQMTQLFLARTLSSKLYEVIELLNGKTSWYRTNDQVIKIFQEKYSESLREHSDSDGFAIARTLRNDCTSHYSLAAARKNIESLDDSLDCTTYLHENEGNSFSLLGENVVFNERFRVGRLPGEQDANEEKLGVWLDWTIATTAWLKKISADFAVTVLPDDVQFRLRENQLHWPDPSYVGDLSRTFAPVFLRSINQ